MFYLHLFGCGSFLTLDSNHYVAVFKDYDFAIAPVEKYVLLFSYSAPVTDYIEVTLEKLIYLSLEI